MKQEELQHVFVIGCKGIPAHYGGFETFVDKLASYQKSSAVRYHVACAAPLEEYDPKKAHFMYHRAECTTFPWRRLGAARAVAYDLEALRYFISYAKKNTEKKKIKHPIFYILACRIGPFLAPFARSIHAMGGELYVNPDGHEFLRKKWSVPVRRYWKYSERLTVKCADLLICDSKNIERYIHKEYAAYSPRTTYIAYGADVTPSALSDDDAKLREWHAAHGLRADGYYLAVGRFVPENNYEIMLREFMKSDTHRSFALITDVQDDFLEKLKQKTGFDRDPRIVFTGTVYDQELLKKIRECAYGYFHGHEVGGTNPSLLEALAATKLNLLLDVGFNREAAKDSAYYWTKAEGNLAALIKKADALDCSRIAELGQAARGRIAKYYSWESITQQYEQLFLHNTGIR